MSSNNDAMSVARETLNRVLEKLNLPYPLPARRDQPTSELISEYIAAGPKVMELLEDEPLSARIYATSLAEHVSTKQASQWEDAKQTFTKAPDDFTKSQLAYWLRSICGSSKKRVDDLCSFALTQSPVNLREILAFLATRVNQPQWDSIAPKMIVPDDQSMIRNLISRKASALDKNGVVPWFPETD